METFTQPKITGYRQLTEAEVDLMNQIKALGNEVGELVELIAHLPHIDDSARWASIAKTQLQQGFMALTRAVARPTSF